MKSYATKLSTGLLAATVSLTLANQAQAFTFSGSSSGEWGMPTNPSASTIISSQNGGTNNRLSWGRIDLCGGGCTPFNNYVQYDKVSFNTAVDSLFNIGNLSYRNGSTWNNFDGDFTLNLSLSFINPFNNRRDFNFLFNIFNTPNVTGDAVLDGDRLRFSTAGLTSETFNYDGVDYTLELVGFSADGGQTIVSEFNSPEGAIANASLYGKITAITPPTPQSVPEPGTIIALSALGIYSVFRYRQKKAD